MPRTSKIISSGDYGDWNEFGSPCPFLEISHAAKVGTVVGSVDLGKLTNQGEVRAALLPGTIPQVHRGIILLMKLIA